MSTITELQLCLYKNRIMCYVNDFQTWIITSTVCVTFYFNFVNYSPPPPLQPSSSMRRIWTMCCASSTRWSKTSHRRWRSDTSGTTNTWRPWRGGAAPASATAASATQKVSGQGLWFTLGSPAPQYYHGYLTSGKVQWRDFVVILNMEQLNWTPDSQTRVTKCHKIMTRCTSLQTEDTGFVISTVPLLL